MLITERTDHEVRSSQNDSRLQTGFEYQARRQRDDLISAQRTSLDRTGRIHMKYEAPKMILVSKPVINTKAAGSGIY